MSAAARLGKRIGSIVRVADVGLAIALAFRLGVGVAEARGIAALDIRGRVRFRADIGVAAGDVVAGFRKALRRRDNMRQRVGAEGVDS